MGLCPIPIFLLAHDIARTRCSVNTHGTKAGVTALTEGGMVEASSPPPVSQARSG